jgi:hypothetical protein
LESQGWPSDQYQALSFNGLFLEYLPCGLRMLAVMGFDFVFGKIGQGQSFGYDILMILNGLDDLMVSFSGRILFL